MPPEQALGRDTIDAQTDIWAVGAVMFWAIAGRLVHLAESVTGQLVAQATQHAPALASVVPEVPAAIAAIVDRALRFEQGQRWPDASAMQQAIREAQDALGLPRAPLPSLSSRADSSPRLPSSLNLERMAVGSSARSRTEEADTLAQAPPARRRAPMAIGIAAAAAIAVYLLVRSGHDDAPPAASPTEPGVPAQAQPIPAPEPAVAPVAPPPSTAAPASESPGGASSGDPVPASSAAPDAPRKRPPPKASSTPPPAATPASDEDWLSRQH
jgi:serine/threonine-protein kinase